MSAVSTLAYSNRAVLIRSWVWSLLEITGLAPRIFFFFAPLLREEGGGGGGSEGRGNFSKNRGKRRKKGGGGVDAGKGSGAFLGGRRGP